MKVLVILCGASGVGKTTMRDEIENRKLLDNYRCIDTDGVGINWWDYAGTENETKFTDDCLKEAVKLSEDDNILFVGCISPPDYYANVNIPQDITSTFYIGMTCSDEEIVKRLKARPKERMCGTDEFIASQIEYNNWIKNNTNKFQFYIDNTGLAIEQTAVKIAQCVNKINELTKLL